MRNISLLSMISGFLLILTGCSRGEPWEGSSMWNVWMAPGDEELGDSIRETYGETCFMLDTEDRIFRIKGYTEGVFPFQFVCGDIGNGEGIPTQCDWPPDELYDLYMDDILQDTQQFHVTGLGDVAIIEDSPDTWMSAWTGDPVREEWAGLLSLTLCEEVDEAS